MTPRAFFVALGCGAAAFVAAAFFFTFAPTVPDISKRVTISPTQTILLNGVPLRVAVADSENERTQGLSGYQSLAQDEGMLFKFEKEALYSFWMQDMLFPIDILWISSEGRVVFIEKNISPDTFPQSFTSTTPARYVLEVQAGFSEKYGIKVGDRAVF